ncbi:hypothetical protein BUALT_Bualt08G0053100 [Buddleja alternifolia]|uniref:BRI1 kinase inhibitor 1 n=1 Tax=Buddleja alternifolia TaxID=168488 RepID=A0AAV6X4A2_9LAMI|nr:hypothetical protein BUALT_Bualt08G0053100 [Buddleja alternifolia]
MEIQNQILRDNKEAEEKDIKGKKVQQMKQQVQLNPAPHSPSPSPPSSSSSPSHEFSFTISLHPTATKIPDNKNKSPPPPFAVDLSPADEIFFHGHLLPLHLLTHLPATSARSSTNSIDNFTLPIKELSQEHNKSFPQSSNKTVNLAGKVRKESKSFSLFGSKWRKSSIEQTENDRNHEKRTSKFEVLKRYIRLVKPFIHSLRYRKIRNPNLVRHSYSGNLRVKSKKELRGRRGGFSAPATMRNSPTNSGRLVASGSLTPTSMSDSTMEELQAAIQAAIAHCKNSVATQDQIKMPS